MSSLFGIVLFVWVPGTPIDWAKSDPILIGGMSTLVIGEILLLLRQKKGEAL